MKKDYVLVDEKKFADWIVFANEFAAFINYYGVANAIAGNWQPFFSNDIAAQLGSIAIQDIENYRLEIKKRFDFIKNDDNKSSVGDIKIKLNEPDKCRVQIPKNAIGSIVSVITYVKLIIPSIIRKSQ